MNMLMYVISTCFILGVLVHAVSVVIKDTKAAYNMNVATAKKVMFGSNTMVSTTKVKKELRRQRIMNTVGLILGFLSIVTLIGAVLDFVLRTFLFY